MKPDEFVTFFGVARASAILRTNIAQAAAPAMDAAIRGGFKVIEFTLTTPNAFDLIREFAQRTEVVVGAGTVMTVQDAQSAVEAGAKFIVSPVFDEEVVREANRLGVAAMPGAHSPTELIEAHRAGAQLQKLFPAPGSIPDFIESILGPLPFLKIVPTNGVTKDNVSHVLRAGAFAVGFTTTLFNAEDIQQGRFDSIETKAGELLAATMSW